ncbi:MAG TPA: right-handed parallel beta-helix repeat-containing protein [Candidatus Hydrogenedentes bacterium]|nr:right-handed parallel beta-helix repeat-containing protein [Candidatus Hydrogenedentota bacterium]HPG68867.1 right-handed parallel beta-helix repeat-containing protein [Candidatus Hydrogenedentota bacterium]
MGVFNQNICAGLVLGSAIFLLTLLVALVAATAEAEDAVSAVAGRAQAPVWPEPAAVLYVAPDGSDAAPGTKEQPFGTLEHARDAVRQLRQDGKLAGGGATVFVRGGRYRVSQPFALAAEDSGTSTAPIRYRAVEGETPVFSGGVRIEGFEPVTDAAILARLPEEARGKVVQTDLARYGVTDVKPLRLGGFNSGLGFVTHPVMELFFDGKAMPMSRWPNEGFVRVADVAVKDGLTMHGREGSKIGRLIYDGDRPRRWKDEPAVVLYGYWFFDWADSYERVASIDTETREFALEEPYCGYGYRPDAPYYAVNLLCEIDMPGEWYLDRATGVLYFYPPSDPGAAVVELSVIDHPFVQLDNVSHTALEGFVWELGGADAVVVRDGDHCLVAGCTVRRCGGNGIVVDGGQSHSLLGCDIYSMGRGGMVVSGGDRKTLTPGNHLIENCDVHELSRIDHTYTPAIVLSGVGSRIARNRFHDIPSSAIRLGGNEHVVELNEIHHVVQESDDQGGADMWGNATYRGNVYRYNYWHHIGNQVNPHEEPGCGQAGIRLDDAISGTRIYGNIFYRASAGKLGFGGVQIHGGKDNVVDNNVFLECMAAVSFSAWGDERWRKFVAAAMDAEDIDPALYLERYPQLERLAEDHDVNTIAHNLVLNCEELFRRDSGRAVVENNIVTNEDALKATERGIDLHSLTPFLAQHGLAPIPFDEIGLYTDAYRPALPPGS